MKNKLMAILIASMLLLTSCGEKPLDKEEITIYHATDIHYLSQQLTDNSPEFARYIRIGDGKMTHYIEQITDAFVTDVIQNKPDYVLIGGDITFNGEKLSHEDFAAKLKKIEDAGTQVLVIPGNHDVDYPFCYGYKEGRSQKAERMTDEYFETVYADYGLNQAYSRDKNSFSYMYRLTDKITLIALDSNRGAGNSVVAPETIEWLEEELKKVKEGTTLIALTHQNLFEHFTGGNFSVQYSIINCQPVIDLFEKYGVKLNISGHIHTQHKRTNGNITDIATESMAVMPCNYGVITCNSEKITYKTQSVDVESWAKSVGRSDENLLNFSAYSLDFYMDNQINRSLQFLLESDIPEDDRQKMAEFFAELNTYYFTGTTDHAAEYLMSTDGYTTWVEKGKGTRHYDYIMKRVEEGISGANYDEREIPLKK